MVGVTDHVTLEFPRGRSHLTSYGVTGRAKHRSSFDKGYGTAWRLCEIPNGGVALWLTILVRTSTLVKQHLAMQVKATMRTWAERHRREQQFEKYLNERTSVTLSLPSSERSPPEYVCCNIYLVTDPNGDHSVIGDRFLDNRAFECVDDWPDSAPFDINTARLERGGHDLIFASACPPGKLKMDVVVGLALARA